MTIKRTILVVSARFPPKKFYNIDYKTRVQASQRITVLCLLGHQHSSLNGSIVKMQIGFEIYNNGSSSYGGLENFSSRVSPSWSEYSGGDNLVTEKYRRATLVTENAEEGDLVTEKIFKSQLGYGKYRREDLFTKNTREPIRLLKRGFSYRKKIKEPIWLPMIYWREALVTKKYI